MAMSNKAATFSINVLSVKKCYVPNTEFIQISLQLQIHGNAN